MGKAHCMDEFTGGTTRNIKVGRILRECGGTGLRAVPFIRLSGKWLERAGFLEGDTIMVAAVDGQIRITRPDQRSASGWRQGELF